MLDCLGIILSASMIGSSTGLKGLKGSYIIVQPLWSFFAGGFGKRTTASLWGGLASGQSLGCYLVPRHIPTLYSVDKQKSLGTRS